jgi:hypothetical protein
MMGWRRRSAVGVLVVVALAGGMVVSQFGGSSAAARQSGSGVAGLVSGSGSRADAARLKAQAARLVARLDRAHPAGRHAGIARKDAKAEAAGVAGTRWRTPSAVNGCIRGAERGLRVSRRAGAAGAGTLPGPRFASPAQIRRLIDRCLTQPGSANTKARAVSQHGKEA